MQLTRALMIFGCVVGSVMADDCDNGTCSSSGTSSSLGPRESAVTVVETSFQVLTSTDINKSVYITSLPKSLYTRTTQVAVDTTLVPVLTPSVISAASTYVVHTITGTDGKQSTTTVIPTGATVVSGSSGSTRAASGSTGAAASSSRAVAASSSTSTAGAYATVIPAGVALAMMGFAAAL